MLAIESVAMVLATNPALPARRCCAESFGGPVGGGDVRGGGVRGRHDGGGGGNIVLHIRPSNHHRAMELKLELQPF